MQRHVIASKNNAKACQEIELLNTDRDTLNQDYSPIDILLDVITSLVDVSCSNAPNKHKWREYLLFYELSSKAEKITEAN